MFTTTTVCDLYSECLSLYRLIVPLCVKRILLCLTALAKRMPIAIHRPFAVLPAGVEKVETTTCAGLVTDVRGLSDLYDWKTVALVSTTRSYCPSL